jgi:predicted RecB family nuclease
MHSTTADLPADVDTSEVPPQPAVVSYRCPVRVALDHDPSRRHLKAPLDPAEVARGEETRDHVDLIRARLGAAAATDPTVVVIDRTDPDGEELTLRAVRSGARLIVGARLPTDAAAHRLGCSTVLIRSDPEAGGGWYPVEIRRHFFTREAAGSTVTASLLAAPSPTAATLVQDTAIRSGRHNENGRQLAHRWRLLENMGVVLPGQRAMGGVIDRTGDRIWWVDLEDARWPTRWTTRKVTMLEHYDHGFDFRLRTIAHQSGRDEPLMESAVPPVRIGECSTCPWERLCLREMESVDHVSLIPRSTFDHYAVHKARGITTRAQVAELHWPTAYAMHGPEPRSVSVDLSALMEVTTSIAPDTPLADALRPVRAAARSEANGTADHLDADLEPVQLTLLGIEPEPAALVPEVDPDESALPDLAPDPEADLVQAPIEGDRHLVPLERVDHIVHRFAEVGILTVEDLNQLDPFTASYSGEPCGHLPSVIDQARAASAGRPFLARGVRRPDVPRADVEVDVDMENVEEGVYLWGTYVSGDEVALDRIGLLPGYRPFWDMEPMSDMTQVRVFSRFWYWLADVRGACARAGLSFTAYCYTSAEHQKMGQVVAAAPPGSTVPLPTRQEVDDLVRSAEWVDVYDVVRSSLVVGHGLGLKKVAPLAGFEWRDDDAGGLQSMAWHREAMENPDPAVRAFNRSRLLTYNEDDVRATLAVRDWLTTADIPPIDHWKADVAADGPAG